MRRHHPIPNPLLVPDKEAREFRGIQLLPYLNQTRFEPFYQVRHSRQTDPVQQLGNIGFIEGRCISHQIAQVPGGFLAKAGIKVRGSGILPSSLVGEPARHAEVRISQQRGQMMLLAGGQHAPVVFQLGVGKESFLGFNARPFQGKAIGVKPKIGQHAYVLRIEVVVVASVARRFFKNASRQVLDQPQVAAGVVALHLMSRGRAAPQKLVGKGLAFLSRAGGR